MEAWQPHEVEDYRQVKSEYLDELYAARDILTTDPEERARYLTEDVLDLNAGDRKACEVIAADRGRPFALNQLEELAIKSQKE